MVLKMIKLVIYAALEFVVMYIPRSSVTSFLIEVEPSEPRRDGSSANRW